MTKSKTYDNGLRLIVNKVEGLFSVTLGVLVKTGSKNETEKQNGISHYIEHMMFKGTPTRSSFDISDQIDRIGAQINAFTSKEITCYYTKSTKEHFAESAEILSDIFFNSTFDEKEGEKEKGVVIEEINMCDDTPEDICLDLLAKSYYGERGLGQTILGSVKNVSSFTREDIKAYMDEYYQPENIVISVAGSVDFDEAEMIIGKLFADNFKSAKKAKQGYFNTEFYTENLIKIKNIEQAHLALCMPSYPVTSDKNSSLSILNTVFGGGMSSRLFQKIREELGLAYSVYSYLSQYEKSGVLEIYAGVNPAKRDLAFGSILDEINLLNEKGITNQEFLRGKEQVKSAFIMSQESTASLMLLFGKRMLFFNEIFDFERKIADINACTLDSVNDCVKDCFDLSKASCCTVGRKRSKLKFNA